MLHRRRNHITQLRISEFLQTKEQERTKKAKVDGAMQTIPHSFWRGMPNGGGGLNRPKSEVPDKPTCFVAFLLLWHIL